VSAAQSSAAIRRFVIDLPPASTMRLERLKAGMDASSYGEVIRAALRELEVRLADAAARCTAAEASRK
jgi:hypothetical protein